LKFFDAKKFDFDNINGISKCQLDQHYTLYTRYVDAMNKVSIEMNDNNLYKNCNPNFSNLRNTQIALTYNLDSIKLHELYFENMTGLNNDINGKIQMVINNTFGSYENFIDKFKCIGLSMRGWVILCYDYFSNDYYIYGQDSHNTEISMNTYPLIVMDVYEHAYMIDFGIDKAKYIDAFFKNLDFKVINNRFNV